MIRDQERAKETWEKVKATHGRCHCQLQLNPSCNCKLSFLFIRMKLSLELDFTIQAAIKLKWQNPRSAFCLSLNP